MSESKAVSIVIADDHAMVREGLAAILAARLELQAIAECADGASALELIEKLRPDFAVIALNIRKISGLEVVRRLRAAGSGTRLIVLSANRDEVVAAQVLRAGADAYVLKDGPSQQLIDAINYIRPGVST